LNYVSAGAGFYVPPAESVNERVKFVVGSETAEQISEQGKNFERLLSGNFCASEKKFTRRARVCFDEESDGFPCYRFDLFSFGHSLVRRRAFFDKRLIRRKAARFGDEISQSANTEFRTVERSDHLQEVACFAICRRAAKDVQPGRDQSLFYLKHALIEMKHSQVAV
jgi:hypothetical protein